MDRYCVVISGLRAGAADVAAWAPVAAAFKLDDTAFADRVVAALPLIVRQNLDQAAANRLAVQLQAMKIDARAWPDDEQLVYLQRDGTARGPLPLSALSTFIKTGENYRLRGHPEWREWAPPLPTRELPTLVPADPNGEEGPPPLPTQVLLNEPVPPSFLATPATTTQQTGLTLPDAPAQEEPPPLPAPQQWRSELPPPMTEQQPAVAFHTNQTPTSSPTALLGTHSSAVEPSLTPAHISAPASQHTSNQSRPARAYKWLWIGGTIPALVVAGFSFWAYTHRGATGPDITATIATTPARLPVAQPLVPIPAPAAALTNQSSVTALPTAADNKLHEQAQPPAPTVSAGLPSATEHCDADAPRPQTPEEITLLANGQRHLTGRAVRAGPAGEIYVVEAALGYDGMCRPSPYQIYVFNHGKLVGTLSPDAMQARTDGAITDFELVDPQHLQIEIAHYKPSDPLCCASSHETRLIALSQLGLDSTAPATPPDPDQIPHAQAAKGPSFDCAKARSVTDVMICADGTLSRLDLEQAQLYRQAMAQASPDNAHLLKESQRQWLRNRELLCGADKTCLERQFNDRIVALRQEYQ